MIMTVMNCDLKSQPISGRLEQLTTHNLQLTTPSSPPASNE